MAIPEVIKDIDARVIRPTSTDNAIVRFDGTTGQIQNTANIIDDSNNTIINGSLTLGNHLAGSTQRSLQIYSNNGLLYCYPDGSSAYHFAGVPVAFDLNLIINGGMIFQNYGQSLDFNGAKILNISQITSRGSYGLITTGCDFNDGTITNYNHNIIVKNTNISLGQGSINNAWSFQSFAENERVFGIKADGSVLIKKFSDYQITLSTDGEYIIGRNLGTLNLQSNTYGTGSAIENGNITSITFGHEGSAQAGIYCPTSGSYGTYLIFATTNSYADGAKARMVINHLGNIGIGTISPSSKLHVRQSSSYTTNSTIIVENGVIGINNYGHTLQIGNLNSSYTHFETSCSKFYFNKSIQVDGNILPYQNNIYSLGDANQYFNLVKTQWLHVNSNGSGSDGGITLYANGDTNYAIMFRTTSNLGTHGFVDEHWATYFTMSNSPGRGWIFKNLGANSNVASISVDGSMYLNNRLRVRSLSSVEEGHVPMPGGGTYKTTASSITGALKITLPQYFTNTMLKFCIDIYNYASSAITTYVISGYNYQPSLSWYNYSAKAIGNNTDHANLNVRFGYDGSKCCIWIGETSTVWYYPQIVVRDFYAGYSNYGSSLWETGWSISFVSSFGTITNVYSDTNKFSVTALYGAVWNDYAEYRESDITQPGRCIIENGDDTLRLSTKRLQRGAEIVSDTFGFAIGETDTCKTPIAASGRVLAYGYEDREYFKSHIGYPVCSGPNGTVSIMTDEEEQLYPSRIIGYISAVPDYEIWGTGNVKVDGRIWIRIK